MEPEDLREQLRNTPFEQLQPIVLQKLAGYQPVAPGILDVVPFLQALVEFAPSPAGQHAVAVGISSCATDLCLERLAQRYWYGLIFPIRASGRETPPPSDHPSRPTANFDAAVNVWPAEPSKCDRRAARELVLHREDYRCAITRRVDAKAVGAGNTEIQHNDIPTTVYYARILPFSLVPGANEEPAIDRSSTIWQVISEFSGLSLDELNGNNTDRPGNGIALDYMLHRWLRNLSLCFEPTPQPDIYTILYWNDALIWNLPKTVSFVSRSGIPVPDPRYLSLHAACAKVVHASGMANILNGLIEDLELTNVLSSDGSSAHLLHHALIKIAWQ